MFLCCEFYVKGSRGRKGGRGRVRRSQLSHSDTERNNTAGILHSFNTGNFTQNKLPHTLSTHCYMYPLPNICYFIQTSSTLANYVDIDNNYHIFKQPWVHILFNKEQQKQSNTVQMHICMTIELCLCYICNTDRK